MSELNVTTDSLQHLSKEELISLIVNYKTLHENKKRQLSDSEQPPAKKHKIDSNNINQSNQKHVELTKNNNDKINISKIAHKNVKKSKHANMDFSKYHRCGYKNVCVFCKFVKKKKKKKTDDTLH